MMNSRSVTHRRQHRWFGAVLLGLPTFLAMLLAACGQEKPAPPPPPPPPAIPIPPRPIAPNGAQDNIPVPPLDPTGLRVSVNRNITPAQSVWNLRSALNVAALNCNQSAQLDIIPSYRAFLKAYSKPLAKANRTIDTEFRAKYGTTYVRQREAYLTSVYNHFSLPPTQSDFCDAVQAVFRDMAPVKPVEFEQFATRSLPNIEIVFDNFYRRYEAYRANLNDWKARYQPSAPVSIVLPPLVPASGASAAGEPATASGHS
jgi:hypothetical protein